MKIRKLSQLIINIHLVFILDHNQSNYKNNQKSQLFINLEVTISDSIQPPNYLQCSEENIRQVNRLKINMKRQIDLQQWRKEVFDSLQASTRVTLQNRFKQQIPNWKEFHCQDKKNFFNDYRSSYFCYLILQNFAKKYQKEAKLMNQDQINIFATNNMIYNCLLIQLLNFKNEIGPKLKKLYEKKMEFQQVCHKSLIAYHQQKSQVQKIVTTIANETGLKAIFDKVQKNQGGSIFQKQFHHENQNQKYSHIATQKDKKQLNQEQKGTIQWFVGKIYGIFLWLCGFLAKYLPLKVVLFLINSIYVLLLLTKVPIQGSCILLKRTIILIFETLLECLKKWNESRNTFIEDFKSEYSSEFKRLE